MTKKRTDLRPSYIFTGGSSPSPIPPGSGSTNAGHVKLTVSKPKEGKELHTI